MSEDASNHQQQPAPGVAAQDRRAVPRQDSTRQAHHDAIFALARASEINDEDTGAHVMRIRLVVEQMAIRLGFDADDARELGYDAMLHDVGKLRVPPDVLKKPGQLDQRERQVMRSHTVSGERLLSDRPSMQRAACIARSHHENWDGTGYPDGLRGEDIPLEARITAAADVLDALLSSRVYKESWSYEEAIREVLSLAGSKLDPRIVSVIEQCHRDGTLSKLYRGPIQSTHELG